MDRPAAKPGKSVYAAGLWQQEESASRETQVEVYIKLCQTYPTQLLSQLIVTNLGRMSPGLPIACSPIMNINNSCFSK